MEYLNQKNYISEVLRQLPTVTKNNLRQAIFSELDIFEREGQAPDISRYKWQILINEVYTREMLNFCKLYKELNSKEVIAVFPNLKERDGSLQAFAFSCCHFTAHPDYLKTRCTRIKPDAPEAKELVSYLLNNYASNYHTETPILL